MIQSIRKIATCLFLLACSMAGEVSGQGLVMNEVSNGPTGNQEFMEMVVVGPSSNPNCGPVDIRGWIVDDNNGDFSCGACAGTGIAAGHVRFSNAGVWAAVPTGSIIVLYDPQVKNPKVPADDPDDTAPADGVYVLSTGHATIETATTPCTGGAVPSGVGACGACTGVITYAGACYTPGLINATTGLRNSGDAAQTRLPNGTYFHGLGYGTAASLINGGPDNLFLTGDGSGKCYALTNAISNDYRLAGNFSTALVSANAETPGVANSLNNAAWIATLTAPCLLSVNYLQPLTATPSPSANLLQWSTATEVNADRWDVMRSLNAGQDFEQIGTVEATGNSTTVQHYSFSDLAPGQDRVWYQLQQRDLDGTISPTEVVEIVNAGWQDAPLSLIPNPSEGRLRLRASWTGTSEILVTDLMGRTAFAQAMDAQTDAVDVELDLRHLAPGQYILQLRGRDGMRTARLDIR